MSPYRIPGCTSAVVLVLAFRQVLQQRDPIIQAAVGLAVGALLATAGITPVRSNTQHQPLADHLDVLFEDVDDVNPVTAADV